MSRAKKRVRRQAFHGWIKWLPVPAMLFSVIFFDCWLSTQQRVHDFELSRLRADIRETEAKLEVRQSEAAELETLERLDLMADKLGLQVPEPNQIEKIYYDPARDAIVPSGYPFSIARLDNHVLDEMPVPVVSQPRTIGKGLPEAATAWE